MSGNKTDLEYQVKKLKKGEFVGYGASYRAKEDEIIGIMPVRI